jgi:hypothetical protein
VLLADQPIPLLIIIVILIRRAPLLLLPVRLNTFSPIPLGDIISFSLPINFIFTGIIIINLSLILFMIIIGLDGGFLD